MYFNLELLFLQSLQNILVYPDMAMYTCNSSTWEEEEAALRILGQPGRHSEFKVRWVTFGDLCIYLDAVVHTCSPST